MEYIEHGSLGDLLKKKYSQSSSNRFSDKQAA